MLFFPGGFQDETYRDWERDSSGRRTFNSRSGSTAPPSGRFCGNGGSRKPVGLSLRRRGSPAPLRSVARRREFHFFFKPRVTQAAAREYGVVLPYRPFHGADIYAGILDFADTVRADRRDLRPRDRIDIQSFPLGPRLGRVRGVRARG